MDRELLDKLNNLAEALYHERGDFEAMEAHRRAALAISDDPAVVARAGHLEISRWLVEGRYAQALRAAKTMFLFRAFCVFRG